ncbi:hypothetical protein ACSD7O_19595 [Methylorubrum extorquens]|uniref:hypothetical protein n=1 Tax=Methylorubrum extorquens TaxID=408 RepID=UPI003F60868A
MRDVETLKGLLSRVQSADAPDEDLDAEILIGAGVLTRIDRLAGADATPVWEYRDASHNQAGPHHPMVLRVTGSIDAAVALVGRVLPRWDLGFDINGVGGLKKGWATLRGPDLSDSDMSQFAQTDGLPLPPPLAICAALLQALIAQSQEAPRHGE